MFYFDLEVVALWPIIAYGGGGHGHWTQVVSRLLLTAEAVDWLLTVAQSCGSQQSRALGMHEQGAGALQDQDLISYRQLQECSTFVSKSLVWAI